MDNYIISITPMPVSHSFTNIIKSPPWNVTLDYNVVYTASAVAANCAGESSPNVLPDIEYGKSVSYAWFL